ncbi:MAG: T9SS type A sorting domain-containing protein [Bacteroidetes bacterium]|nr:T9SS type A sorting domain-containing protein [Bacteroidota bacterium]
MRKLITLLACGAISTQLSAQISITAADMPVAGDTLRYSNVVALGSNINLTNTGANIAWDFSNIVPISQAVDAYKTAMQVNPVYALTISTSAYGYKVADSLPGMGGLLPISVKDLYTFFAKKTNPSRFIADAFGANISGLPTAANYSDPDEWYFFPLQFGNHDSSTFKLSYSLASIGSFSQAGNRVSTVDGWGTIMTPHFTSPVNCIRIRSVINEVDSISFSGTSFGIPRKSVEYKWLLNGEHYPALWVTTTLVGSTETITTIRFRDHYRPALGIADLNHSITMLSVYPNPVLNGNTSISVPSAWNDYQIEVYDTKGSLLISQRNNPNIATDQLCAGQYLIRVNSENGTGFAKFLK